MVETPPGHLSQRCLKYVKNFSNSKPMFFYMHISMNTLYCIFQCNHNKISLMKQQKMKHALLYLLTCSIEDRIGADDCGSSESNVSRRTSMNSGSVRSSTSSSELSVRSKAGKAFLQHMTSSDAASEYSPDRSSTCRNN